MGQDGKNRRIPPNISVSAGPDFTKFSRFGRHMHDDYKTDISFVVTDGRCYGNQLIILGLLANVEIECLHSSIWRSETKCHIILYMHVSIAALMPLHRVKRLVNIYPVTSEFVEFLPRLGHNYMIVVHLAR